MSAMLRKGNRGLAVLLALAMLCCGALQVFSLTAAAADGESKGYNDVYEYIAEQCYSDQPVAAAILNSDALHGGGYNYQTHNPDGDQLSFVNGMLTAARCFVYAADGNVCSVWEPVTYAIGGLSGVFPTPSGNQEKVSTEKLGLEGRFRAEVLYRMDTGFPSEMLHLPATLAAEAADQIAVLNHLLVHAMPCMEQMSSGQMQKLYDVSDPDAPFADRVVLSADASSANKSDALKRAIREVLAEMLTTCYTADGALKLSVLLSGYEKEGLGHYYRNSEDYRTELAAFSRCLNKLQAEEIHGGVSLLETDKLHALGALVNCAQQLGYIEKSTDLDFVKLKRGVDVACAGLVPCSEMIDRNSGDKLQALAGILETEATKKNDEPDVTGVQRWISVVTAYNQDKLILEHTVARELTCRSVIGTDTFDVSTADELNAALAAADAGGVVRIVSAIAMTQDIPVSGTVRIEGAEKLDAAGHVLMLMNPEVSITADGLLSVVSGADGYVPVKARDTNTYTLVEVQHPEIGGKVAGSKTEKLNGNRYLYLDLDPANGMTLDALSASTSFVELAGCTVKCSVEGNSGNDLVKTADHLVVQAFNADAACVSKVTYVIIVMGDTNCNGRVNTSDAAVIKNISMGNEVGVEACMAADVNFSGTLEKPRVNSSDISFMMSKWFAWDLNKYVSNLK